MARLTRYVMVLGTVLGLNSVAPAPVQAGVIPWMYDAVFGPVGSIRANRVAYGTNYGSGYGMAYSAYGPTTVAYAPVSMASYGGYGGGGCSTCSQSANYAPAYAYDSYYGGPSYVGYGAAQSYVGSGCSTCNSCGTGGYVGGSTCSNCAVNPVAPAPSTSTYYGGTPTPGSPSPETSSVLQRLNQLELHQKEIDRKLKLEHNTGGAANDPYLNNNDPFTNSTRRPGTANPESVPARRKTFESGPPDETFSEPLHKRAPGSAPFNEDGVETKKPELDLTPPVTIPDPKPAESEPQVRRLESRVTTRAVAPRDRMPVAKKPAATTKMSQSNKKATTSWLDSSLTSDVVRN